MVVSRTAPFESTRQQIGMCPQVIEQSSVTYVLARIRWKGHYQSHDIRFSEDCSQELRCSLLSNEQRRALGSAGVSLSILSLSNCLSPRSSLLRGKDFRNFTTEAKSAEDE
jgi:hypothetical protein